MSIVDSSDLTIEYVEFYVQDAEARAHDLVEQYGFVVAGSCGAKTGPGDEYALALRQGETTLVLTEAASDEHPAAMFVRRHGDGVANIALGTADVAGAVSRALGAGARVVAGSAQDRGPHAPAVVAFGDVNHVLVERSHAAAGMARALPAGFTPVPGATAATPAAPRPGATLIEIDHFAACLTGGTLDDTVAFYSTALGFGVIFEERIVVGSQAMLSRVVQSASGNVTLTLIEPDCSADPGQIDEFLKNNDGPGIQHIAFRTSGINNAVALLQSRGVEFLSTPAAYYRLLEERLELATYGVDQLQSLNILVDEDHDGQLFQIFTRSAHPRRTFFFELIERLGARTFGSGNIRALYEAVEAERVKVPG